MSTISAQVFNYGKTVSSEEFARLLVLNLHLLGTIKHFDPYNDRMGWLIVWNMIKSIQIRILNL